MVKRSNMSRRTSSEEGGCEVCGAVGVPLERHHIVPLAAGGADEKANILRLCPNCHRKLGDRRFTEIEFNHFLASLLRESSEYSRVQQESVVSAESRFRADITATAKNGESVLIECKNTASFTSGRFHQVIAQIESYRANSQFDRYILAIPGLLSESQKLALGERNIEAWDAQYLGRQFAPEIQNVRHPVFQALLTYSAKTEVIAPEASLADQLRDCPPGKEYWPDYQKLTGQILEHLFCPPLETPIPELADHDGVNRRDWILPNYSDLGFWRFIRETYAANYIVVDAKNYKGPVSKNQVLQIANYLKSHGAGLFAIIITRVGANKSALLTMREQWMANRKMIIVLNDDDVETMLRAKSVGGKPENVIGQVIERFRLSM